MKFPGARPGGEITAIKRLLALADHEIGVLNPRVPCGQANGATSANTAASILARKNQIAELRTALGAVQDLVVLKPRSVPERIDRWLRWLPFVYLGVAVFFAGWGIPSMSVSYAARLPGRSPAAASALARPSRP